MEQKPLNLVEGVAKVKNKLEEGWAYTFLTDRAAIGTIRNPSQRKMACEEDAKAGLSELRYQK